MLAPNVGNQIKKIKLRTSHLVSDVLAGAYLSVFRGQGMEFDEVRPYVPGDDVRTIDWNVTARTGVPHIKRFVEERELTVMLVVDMSASLHFGSQDRSKRQAAAELSALIAFSAIHNNDKVGLLLFHSQAETYIPPRKGQRHALRVIREILAPSSSSPIPKSSFLHRALLKLRKKRTNKQSSPNTNHKKNNSQNNGTDIGHALEYCRQVLPRRTVLFVVSDFLDNGYDKALRSLHRKHDVIGVLVTDKREQSLQPAGLVAIRDAENNSLQYMDTDSSRFRAAFANNAQQRIDTLSRQFQHQGVDLIHIDATAPVAGPLIAFLQKRKRKIR